MKRRLIFINTYFQVLVALQLNKTIFKNDEVIILFNDNMTGAKKICDTLSNLNIFKKVVFCKNKGVIPVNKDFRYKIFESFDAALFREKFKYYIEEIDNLYFDEVIAFEFQPDRYEIFSLLYDVNPNIKFSYFEEGIITYTHNTIKSKELLLIDFLAKIFNRAPLYKSIDKFYCFYPEFYNGTYKTIKIPKIDFTDLTYKNLLIKIFDIDMSALNKYKKYKYIFFNSTGNDINIELPIIEHIAKIVGKENFLIKKHPSNSNNYFVKNGYNVDELSYVPFEIIQILYDFCNTTFVNVLSNSILNINMLLEKPIKSIFTYKLIKHNKKNKKLLAYYNNYYKNFENIFFELQRGGKLNNSKIVSSFNELDDLLAYQMK